MTAPGCRAPIPVRRKSAACISFIVTAVVALLCLVSTATAAPLPRTITLATGVSTVTWKLTTSTAAPVAAPVTSVNASWAAPVAGSKWISTDAKQGTLTKGALGTAGKAAITSYATTFALPTGFSAASLSITLEADNAATVLLNGTSIGAQQQADYHPNYQKSWTYSTSTAALFKTGSNTLEVRVADYGTATGLDYAATVTYTPALVNVSNVSLSGDTSSPIGISSIGLTSLPISALVPQPSGNTSSTSIDALQTARTQTARTQTARTQTAQIQTARTQTARTQISRVATAAVTLASLQTARTGDPSLIAQLLTSPLSQLPLLRPGGWPSLLAETTNLKFALPQSTTLGDVLRDPTPPRELVDPTCSPSGTPPCSPVTVDQFILTGTPLGEIPWIAFLLDPMPWSAINPPTGGWCPELTTAGLTSCGTADLSSSILSSALQGLALDQTSLGVRTFGDLNVTAATRPAFLNLPISGLNISGTFLGDITPAQLTTAGKDPNVVIDCGGASPCPYANLRAASAAGKVRSAATWADLGTTINGAPLVDLVLAYADPISLPWEQLNLGSARLEQLFPGTGAVPGVNFLHETLSFTLPCGEPAVASVTMPTGFAYRPGSSVLARNGGGAAGIADPALTTSGVTWQIAAAACGATPANDAMVLTFQVLPGLLPGAFTPSASVAADASGATPGSSSAAVSITPTASTGGQVASNTMIVGDLSSPGKVDRYDVSIPPGKTLTVTLSQLKYDADLVAYLPAGAATAGLLHGTAARPIPVGTAPVGDSGSGASLQPPVLQDIPLLSGRGVAGISSFRGFDSESITTTAVAGTGGGSTYTLQVSGYNGASGPDPYVLIVRVSDPTPLPGCSASPTFGAGVNASTGDDMPTIGAGVDTLILVDRARLRAAFGGTGDTIVNRLEDPASFADPALGIHPAIVPLDADAGVNSTLANWDLQPCSTDRSNLAVKAINDAVDRLGTFSNNNLAGIRNVVIVGDGTVIPHAALPDGTTDTNERDFVGDTIFNGQATQMTGAAGNGMFLSDAPYGAFTPLSVQGQIIYLPQVALGRLGGDGQTILSSIDQYTKSHGVADPNSVSHAPRTAFETDYDFFADGGAQIRNSFTQQLGAGNVSSLFVPTGGAGWTVPQFTAALFPASGPADVIDPNAHFDPARLLAAAGLATRSPSDMYTTSQLDAATPNLDLGASFPQQNSLALRVVFSIGCHFALDVPDTAAGASPSAADTARMLDWEQVMQRKGTAVMVGNLGYGVGDTASVAFDERLMANYAALLDGSRTAGGGLLEAEQGYFRTLSAFSPYDIKVLEEAVLWGFPSYRLPSAGATAPPPSPLATPVAPDPVSGLDATTVDITAAGFHKTTVTDAVTGLQKAYFDNAGQVADVHPYPIMPKAVVDLPAPAGEVAHGAVPLAWAQATQTVDANFASGGYAFSNATVDSAALEPATAARTAYPTGFENIGTTYGLDGTAHQQLVVVPAQFRSNPTGSPAFGSFRTYTDGLWMITYSTNTTDFDGPAFGNLETVVDGTGTAISADVTDSAGVARVFAQALRADGTYWRVELQREGATNRYGGVLGGTDVNPVSEVTYFALDQNGNSSSANNKGPGFVSSPAPSGITNGSLTFTPPLPPPNGWYTSSPTVSVAGTGFSERVDNGSLSPAGTPISVPDGAHTIYAQDAQGHVVGTAPVFVDTGDPTITGAAAPPANANGWRNGDVTVTFTCVDAVSGIATCTQPVKVSTEGAAQSVPGMATDNAGRTAQTTVSGINIDDTPPDLTGVPTTSPNAAGWYTDDVTVKWQASDGLSGIDNSTSPGDSAITGEGTNLSTSQVSVSDKAGNQKTATYGPVKIDRTAPQVSQQIVNDDGTPRSANAAGWFNSAVRVRANCSDNLSGVADCPNDVVLSLNGANESAATGVVHDIAGNASAGATLNGINIDSSAPQTTISSPCTTAGSWCQGSFQLTLDATDQAGLSGVREIHYSIDGGGDQTAAGGHAGVQLNFAGSGQHVISFHAIDRAGNAEPANTGVFNVDSVSPTVTHQISPMPNADGWDRADTTVTFIGTDDPQGAGIDVSTLTPAFTVDFETPGYLLTGNVSDLAGNAAAPDPVTVKVDKTPPIVNASASPAPNASGWNNGPVSIGYTCSDTLSGLATCPATTIVTANGANQMISDIAYDRAGNSAAASTTLNVDSVKPTVSVTGPADGGIYTLGAVPAARCAAIDGLSGVAPAGCSLTTTGGLANGVGTFTVTASASDNAGNANSAQVTYRVVYKWGGFISPVSGNGATAIIKAGLNVPVSFQVARADGTPVQTNTATTWVAPSKGAALVPGTRANAKSTTLAPTPGTSYIWDAVNRRYQFVWGTSSSQAGFFWTLTVTLDDGTTHTTAVGLSQFSGSSGEGGSDPDDAGHQGS